VARSGQQASVGRGAAAIHDLGYKRYLGTRRPQSTRWRVLVKNAVSTSWRGWWRMKIWVIGCAITAVGLGVPMYISRNKVLEGLVRPGVSAGWADAFLPFSFLFFPWLAAILATTTAAGAVARDLRAGAFEFYFSRPVRPVDYVLGKVVGSALVMAAALLAGPLALSLFRVGLAAGDLDELFAALALVPRIALVGALGSIAFAVVALAISSLSSRPRITAAVWVGFYLLFGGVIEGLSAALQQPDLAALNLWSAVWGFAYGLIPVRLPGGLSGSAPGLAASYAALVAYTAIGLVVLHVRVKLAERAGLGGG
jgi:ABC-type transport system involved in multi-copper enzyme maturation permease subunit